MKKYKISDISSFTGLTERTIRYYGELGLLKEKRGDGGHRYYSDQDIVYLKRIIELKNLGFNLDEIKKIVELKSEDESGRKRRDELLKQYRVKLSEEEEKIKALSVHAEELRWHIKQLEEAEDSFTTCPGESCVACLYRDKCIFFKNTALPN